MAAEEISLLRTFWVRKKLDPVYHESLNFDGALKGFIDRVTAEPGVGKVLKKGDNAEDVAILPAFSIKNLGISPSEEFDVEFELYPFDPALARRIELGHFTIEPRIVRPGLHVTLIYFSTFDLVEKE